MKFDFNLDELIRAKSISPLIATILLIVVSVSIILIIISWGKGFTNQSLSSASADLKESSLSYFLYLDKVIENKIYVKNTHPEKDLVVLKYRVVFDRRGHVFPILEDYIYLSEPMVIFKSNSNYIEVPCLISSSFVLELVTSDSKFISFPVKLRRHNEYSYLDCLLLMDFDSTNGVLEDKSVGKVIDNIINNSFDFTTWSNSGSILTKVSNEFITTDNGGVFKNLLIVGNKYRGKIEGTSNADSFSLYNTQGTTGPLVKTGFGSFEFIAINSHLYVRNQGAGKTTINKLIIQEVRNEITPTNVSIEKFGQNYSAIFNGDNSTINASRVDTGSEFIAIKDVTICGWFNISSKSLTTGYRTILTNESFSLSVQTVNMQIYVTSNNASVVTSLSNSVLLNKNTFVALTRSKDGVVNIYLGDYNNQPSLNMNPNQNSGIPISGTTNVFVGRELVPNNPFHGQIPILKVYSGILTEDEILNVYNQTKHIFKN